MGDNNYSPGVFADQTGLAVQDLLLAPPNAGAGFDDLWKLSHCMASTFRNVEVRGGRQKENAQDLNRGSSGNTFAGLVLDAGGQSAILVKGGSSHNGWDDVLIRHAAGHSDIYLGDYAETAAGVPLTERSEDNRFNAVRRGDAEPVRVAWTFFRAQRPVFTNSTVRYQYLLSAVRTVYVEIKYAWKKLFP